MINRDIYTRYIISSTTGAVDCARYDRWLYHELPLGYLKQPSVPSSFLGAPAILLRILDSAVLVTLRTCQLVKCTATESHR